MIEREFEPFVEITREQAKLIVKRYPQLLEKPNVVKGNYDGDQLDNYAEIFGTYADILSPVKYEYAEIYGLERGLAKDTASMLSALDKTEFNRVKKDFVDYVAGLPEDLQGKLISEQTNKNKIISETVDKGYEEVKEIKRKYYLNRLPHHKLIVEIVKKYAGITSSDFYKAYRQEARKQGLNPQSTRTFSNYVSELIETGYLKVDRAKTRGNVRLFYSTEKPD